MPTGDLLCGRTCQALFIAFLTSCHTGPCGRSDGSVSPDMGWWLRDPWSSLAPHDLLSVLPSLGQAPDPAGALGACEARRGPPLLLLGSPCEPVPRNEWPTPAHNPCLAPRDLFALWMLSPDISALRTAPVGSSPVFRKRQSAMSHCRASATIPIVRRRALPCPHLLCYHGVSVLSGCKRTPPHAISTAIVRIEPFPALVIPSSRDGSRHFGRAAGVRPGSRTALLWRLQVPPGKTCHHKYPRPMHPNAAPVTTGGPAPSPASYVYAGRLGALPSRPVICP